MSNKLSIQCWPVQAEGVLAEMQRLFPGVPVQRVEPRDHSVVNFNVLSPVVEVEHLVALSRLVFEQKAILYEYGEDAY